MTADAIAPGAEPAVIRRWLHAHPEHAFEEVETAGLVTAELEHAGYTVHRGVGGTGGQFYLNTAYRRSLTGITPSPTPVPWDVRRG